MNVKKILPVLFLSSLILYSCKKNDQVDGNSSNCPISEISYLDDDNYKVIITYNGDKIVKTESKEKSLTLFVDTYKYDTNKITKTSVDSKGEAYTYVYNLDNNKRIISAQRTDPQNLILQGNYTYNSENQLKSINTIVGSTIFNFDLNYSNGNLVSVNGGSNGISQKNTYIYTYNAIEPYQDLLAQANPLWITGTLLEEFGDMALISAGYFGSQPKNLLVSSNYSSFSYTKDKNGIISKMTEEEIGRAHV